MKDACTKWIEVFEMNSKKSFDSIAALRSVFARFSLPDMLVSDNDPSFMSIEFEDFCHRNDTRHPTSPTYYPESNGAAENAVKIVKRGLNKMLIDIKNKGVPFSVILQRYLYAYRTSVNSITGKSPFEMMFHRKPKLRWDALKPPKVTEEKSVDQECSDIRSFEVGDNVLARDYRKSNFLEGGESSGKSRIQDVFGQGFK